MRRVDESAGRWMRNGEVEDGAEQRRGERRERGLFSSVLMLLKDWPFLCRL